MTAAKVIFIDYTVYTTVAICPPKEYDCTYGLGLRFGFGEVVN